MMRSSVNSRILLLLFLSLALMVERSSARVYYLSKDRLDFIPIADADSFRDLKPTDGREDGSSGSRNARPNLNGTKIRAVYFEDPDYFEFGPNRSSRATGICGDVWSVLADLLNFTLIVTKSRTRSLGTVVLNPDRPSNKNFTDLLGLMQRGRYEAIPKMEAFVERLAAVEFTRSIWKDRYRLFVRPYYRFKSLWMLDLFSWQVWTAATLFYLLLGTVNIIAVSSRFKTTPKTQACSSWADYLFYGFGAMCNQGEPLYVALVESSRRLLALCTGLYSWLLLASYGSQLVIFMQQTYSPAPFTSLDSLLDQSDYSILAERHSIVEIGFRKNYRPIYARIQRADRISFLDTHQDMWSLACASPASLISRGLGLGLVGDASTPAARPYAVLQSEYARMAELAPCELVPVPGESYFKTWIVAGLAKGFRHKRAIDSGITKLHEYGLINALKRRWLEAARPDSRRAKIKKYYSPVGLEQLALVYGLYLSGLAASLVLVILETLAHRVVSCRRFDYGRFVGFIGASLSRIAREIKIE